MATVSLNNEYCQVQVWAKGFRVSQRSEEFQLVVPNDPSGLESLEQASLRLDWSGVLPSLYRLDENIDNEFHLSVHSDSLQLVHAAPSKDRHQRRSVVICIATLPVDWRSPRLEDSLPKVASLLRRLARVFAGQFELAPDHILHQLKIAGFLSERQFDYSKEPATGSIPWVHVAEEICKWNGIRALGTMGFSAFSANVLCCTPNTVPEPIPRGVDAICDLESGRISPHGPAIRLWAPPPRVAPPDDITAALKAIRADQEAIRREHQASQSLLEQMYRAMTEFFDEMGGRRR